jgi:hypothetical protein
MGEKGPFKCAPSPLSAVEGLRRPQMSLFGKLGDASIARLDSLSQAGLVGDNHNRLAVDTRDI